MTRWRTMLLGAAAIAAAFEFMLLFFFNPAEVSFFPPCVFHVLTGLKCPGCGSQRAIHLLLNGQFAASLKMCPAIYFFMAVFVAICVAPKRTATFGFGITVVSAVFVYAVLRNLSLVP